MYGELMDNEKGGREEELYQEERLKEQWIDETGGKIPFDDWLDSVDDPDSIVEDGGDYE